MSGLLESAQNALGADSEIADPNVEKAARELRAILHVSLSILFSIYSSYSVIVTPELLKKK